LDRGEVTGQRLEQRDVGQRTREGAYLFVDAEPRHVGVGDMREQRRHRRLGGSGESGHGVIDGRAVAELEMSGGHVDRHLAAPGPLVGLIMLGHLQKGVLVPAFRDQHDATVLLVDADALQTMISSVSDLLQVTAGVDRLLELEDRLKDLGPNPAFQLRVVLEKVSVNPQLGHAASSRAMGTWSVLVEEANRWVVRRSDQ
jgi:hypothetical protein